MHTGWPKKMAQFFCMPQLHQILTDFHNYFSVRIRKKFVIILSLKIPPHLKYVATLPLWNVKCLKSNNWKQYDFCNNTIFTHVNKSTTRNNVFIVSVIVPCTVTVDHILHEYRWHLHGCLQQDGAPSHTSRNTLTYLRRENVTFIEPHMWPPNSPDLNPVDCAAWGALQQMVYQRRRFKTINQLKQAIVTEWGKLLERFIDGAIGQWQ